VEGNPFCNWRGFREQGQLLLERGGRNGIKTTKYSIRLI